MHIIILSIIISLWADLASAEPHSQPKGLTLQLSSYHPEVNQGDPVLFILTIVNSTDKPISIISPDLVAVGKSYINFWLAKPGQSNYFLIKDPYSGSRPNKSISPPKKLSVFNALPESTNSFTYCLDFDAQGLSGREWLFKAPGDYQVKAELFLLNDTVPVHNFVDVTAEMQSIESTIAVVRIIESSMPENKEAFSDLMQMKEAWYFYNPESCSGNSNDVQAIQQFLAKHSTSRFAQFGKLFLLYREFSNGTMKGNREFTESVLQQFRNIEVAGNWPDGWLYKTRKLSEKMNKEFTDKFH